MSLPNLFAVRPRHTVLTRTGPRNEGNVVNHVRCGDVIWILALARVMLGLVSMSMLNVAVEYLLQFRLSLA